MEKNIDRKKAFDLAKKLLEKGDYSTGYYMEDSGKTYCTHDTREDWNKFVKEMKELYFNAYNRYRNCPGSEMKEDYNKRWKRKMPPKMASYGSSSRFIYEKSREISSFVFEEPLPICIPSGRNSETNANLDGYIPSAGIYVEAKCHEFYSSNSTEFKEKYEDFYDYLKEKTGKFGYHVNLGPKTPTVSFTWDGKPLTQFDFKQVLCHLMGIARRSLEEQGKHSPKLVYLVYKPSDELLKNVESIKDKRAAKSIKHCWETEKKEASEIIDYSLLYRCVVYYMHDHYNIGADLPVDQLKRIANTFTFQFCDQDGYFEALGVE